MDVPFNDLKRHYLALKPELDRAVARVLNSGWYILGPEVEAFETEFAAYCQSTCCIGVANGTQALEIALRALEVGPGDEVITVANAGMYSTTAIRATGARPIYDDVDPHTLSMDPSLLPALVTPRTRVVIVTHLYGRMADMHAIQAFTRRHDLALIEDCAQAHGATLDGKIAGSWGDLACFSFYPTKNLGALGDGGAVVTSDPHLKKKAQMLRQYGWDRKYHSQLPHGGNSRLDELQAAVLRTKLPHLDTWNKARLQVAQSYNKALSATSLQLPTPHDPGAMVHHLYVLQTGSRDELAAHLRRNGIGCDVHYPLPDHLQPACADLGASPGLLPVTECAAGLVLSLPCFAELRPEEIRYVVTKIKEALP